jgi:hypothetical protein
MTGQVTCDKVHSFPSLTPHLSDSTVVPFLLDILRRFLSQRLPGLIFLIFLGFPSKILKWLTHVHAMITHGEWKEVTPAVLNIGTMEMSGQL